MSERYVDSSQRQSLYSHRSHYSTVAHENPWLAAQLGPSWIPHLQDWAFFHAGLLKPCGDLLW